MKTEIEIKNQQAINEFFEAFGADTGIEYSNSIIDLIAMVATSSGNLNHREDLVTKLKDLNRLVSQLGKSENLITKPLTDFYNKN